MVKELQINPRIVGQLSKATVKNLIDGIVELVTNSDDSYRRLEEQGIKVNGEIKISVGRRKGGICEFLIVKDFASGMTKEELERALEFGAETSEFTKGKNVRGFFGRGLKETILALGKGTITTIKDGKMCKTELWLDNKPLFNDEILNEVIPTSEPNGTEIKIIITNDKIKIPDFEKFAEQLSKHYALRDINSSNDRNVELHFLNLKKFYSLQTKIKSITGQSNNEIYETLVELFKDKSTLKKQIRFSYPESKKIKEEIIYLPRFGDKAKLVVYESPVPLDSPRNNPYGLAGILIKTKGAILDNRLFKFENDPAAFYFWGEVLCEDLEERLRKGETELIDFNRGGLEWRHEYCQALEAAIEAQLEPLIREKRKTLEVKPKEVKESTQKMIKKICNLLNELALKELEEHTEVPDAPDPDITTLVVKPEVANIQKDVPRSFTIYAPNEIIEEQGTEAHIKSDSQFIVPMATTVELEKHPKFSDKLWYRQFKVIGTDENAEGNLIVTLGTEKTYSKVKVAPPSHRKSGELTGRRRGFFSDIIPDESESPTQRTFYEKDTGIIRIFIKFPSTAKFIKSGFEGSETPEGKILMAELVGEAFCRELARRKVENNPPPPGGEIDAFNKEFNDLQMKILSPIQEIIFNWNFKS